MPRSEGSMDSDVLERTGDTEGILPSTFWELEDDRPQGRRRRPSPLNLESETDEPALRRGLSAKTSSIDDLQGSLARLELEKNDLSKDLSKKTSEARFLREQLQLNEDAALCALKDVCIQRNEAEKRAVNLQHRIESSQKELKVEAEKYGKLQEDLTLEKDKWAKEKQKIQRDQKLLETRLVTLLQGFVNQEPSQARKSFDPQTLISQLFLNPNQDANSSQPSPTFGPEVDKEKRNSFSTDESPQPSSLFVNLNSVADGLESDRNSTASRSQSRKRHTIQLISNAFARQTEEDVQEEHRHKSLPDPALKDFILSNSVQQANTSAKRLSFQNPAKHFPIRRTNSERIQNPPVRTTSTRSQKGKDNSVLSASPRRPNSAPIPEIQALETVRFVTTSSFLEVPQSPTSPIISRDNARKSFALHEESFKSDDDAPSSPRTEQKKELQVVHSLRNSDTRSTDERIPASKPLDVADASATTTLRSVAVQTEPLEPEKALKRPEIANQKAADLPDGIEDQKTKSSSLVESARPNAPQLSLQKDPESLIPQGELSKITEEKVTATETKSKKKRQADSPERPKTPASKIIPTLGPIAVPSTPPQGLMIPTRESSVGFHSRKRSGSTVSQSGDRPSPTKKGLNEKLAKKKAPQRDIWQTSEGPSGNRNASDLRSYKSTSSLKPVGNLAYAIPETSEVSHVGKSSMMHQSVWPIPPITQIPQTDHGDGQRWSSLDIAVPPTIPRISREPSLPKNKTVFGLPTRRRTRQSNLLPLITPHAGAVKATAPGKEGRDKGWFVRKRSSVTITEDRTTGKPLPGMANAPYNAIAGRSSSMPAPQEFDEAFGPALMFAQKPESVASEDEVAACFGLSKGKQKEQQRSKSRRASQSVGLHLGINREEEEDSEESWSRLFDNIYDPDKDNAEFGANNGFFDPPAKSVPSK